MKPIEAEWLSDTSRGIIGIVIGEAEPMGWWKTYIRYIPNPTTWEIDAAYVLEHGTRLTTAVAKAFFPHRAEELEAKKAPY